MGVPKFFRWMSERYPSISQLIAENRIPEFDCLYLDMNGIIHNCTHKDSDSVSFRMTEDQMFIAIFNYVEHLFGKIRPKQLFFMAIDGVAPRAKMNQQRSRRFRTALDAEKAREKAIDEGIELPKEAPFDSNCITPGTEFMARLTQQLKYFVNKKVSEDSDWQGVEIVLSGHEVPGEGEHKIMEYIRQAKSQPKYDPNVRHCLYGLDADLIMLGLLSHDPHFCLLREEVTFGRSSQKKSKELEHQNFYLMHLCMVREYLEMEFQELKTPGVLEFEFNMERVIDDFILMAFFVGNDFLPNLPHLHINEGALALMFETYKTILPKVGGYINEGGKINLQRLGSLLDELCKVEYRFFEVDDEDASWLKSKQTMDEEIFEKNTKRGKLTLASAQRKLFVDIKNWINQAGSTFQTKPLDLPSTLPARDREFVKLLVNDLQLKWETIEDENGNRFMRVMAKNPLQDGQDDEEDDEDDSEDEEAQLTLSRVMKRYENANVVDITPEQARETMEKKYEQKFSKWKSKYYEGKFDWELDNEDEMRNLAENYVQGLQWVLYYYYRGVASWPWFFRYHYSPMISDVKKGLGADMDFKLGQPFRPFQQLMGVLPDRSKTIVPEAYHNLMTDKDSPIIDFYPRNFELDMNGKKQDWEAVVKIPFIQEDRLLAAMASCEHLLTDDERDRNEFGVTLKFTYSPDVTFIYPSSIPGVFNDIATCHCVENIYELPTMDGLEVFVGLVDGAKLGVEALAGFPSLKTLPFAGALAFHGVSVFQQESRNQSMVVTLLESNQSTKVEQAKQKLGKVVHIGYPFLQEAKITKVSDELFDYFLPPQPNAQVVQVHHNDSDIREWEKNAEKIENFYSKRLGMVIGEVESLVHVEMLKGLRKTDQGDVVKEYGTIPGIETEYAAQTIVDEVISQDERFLEKAALPIEEEFPLGSQGFFLGEHHYGRPLQVVGHNGDKLDIWLSASQPNDEQWARLITHHAEQFTPYKQAFTVARDLGLNPLALSKLTSSFNVNSGSIRLNLGLNLKFEAKKLKVLGYSRKGTTGWEYSQKAIDLIVQYMIKFPDFIAGVQRNPKGDLFNDTDFYPKETAAEKIKEITKWLRDIESKSFEKVPLDANQLDSDAVEVIEDYVDRLITDLPPARNVKLSSVPRHAILKPADAQHRLGEQRFTVGDRVVYAQDSGKVNIGAAGTIVGMTQTGRAWLLDLVMDYTYISGTTLNERCSAFRGATVPTSSILNITDRQVVATNRASAAKQPVSRAPTYYANGYGAPSGPGNAGQLFHASAPPPLMGSFSNAAARSYPRGHHHNGQGIPRHTRGRGGTNGTFSPSNANGISPRGGLGHRSSPAGRGDQNTKPQSRGRGGIGSTTINQKGFTVVDTADPTAGVVENNPNFQPNNYSHVPPPASLNAREGRGARGGGARGRPNGGGRGTLRGSKAGKTQTNGEGAQVGRPVNV